MLRETKIEVWSEGGQTEIVNALEIGGMLSSPIVLVMMENNGGGVSYGVTHRPTGMAIVTCRHTLDEALWAARKIWRMSTPKLREVLALDHAELMKARGEYPELCKIVRAVRLGIAERTKNRIRAEIEAERRGNVTWLHGATAKYGNCGN